MSVVIDMTFEIYIDDDRYSVPTFQVIAAVSEADALQVARLVLQGSPHYRGVELCQRGVRLAGLGSFSTRQIPEDARASRVAG